jgi:hypothetical protein
MPRLRMSGAITPFLLYALMACAEMALPLLSHVLTRLFISAKSSCIACSV